MSTMNIFEIREARYKAENQIKQADKAVREVASLCAGRLQIADVGWTTLEALKRELKNFNMHTGKWNNE